jgi:hypothetical protein
MYSETESPFHFQGPNVLHASSWRVPGGQFTLVVSACHAVRDALLPLHVKVAPALSTAPRASPPLPYFSSMARATVMVLVATLAVLLFASSSACVAMAGRPDPAKAAAASAGAVSPRHHQQVSIYRFVHLLQNLATERSGIDI